MRSLWTPLWAVTVRQVRKIDAISDVMYVRLLADQVCPCARHTADIRGRQEVALKVASSALPRVAGSCLGEFSSTCAHAFISSADTVDAVDTCELCMRDLAQSCAGRSRCGVFPAGG